MDNMTIFDVMYEKFKITKPIKLIELFGGYGSQHFSLEYLKANFTHHKLCEWAVKSIQAYKDAHYSFDNNDYSKEMNKDALVDFLFKKHISMDYDKPMTYEQIRKQSENWCRTVYNNIIATKNCVDITQVSANDLEIKNTDKYEYIMAYSFPCQDLSMAGLRKGMDRDSGTRSGMLWEVERILDELKNNDMEMPQVLLMENVPQVKGTDNVSNFNEWQLKLEKLGYKNYHENIIATDQGIPQTRDRTFMVSILGDYSYTFPRAIPLELKLKDLLEDDVDEKYYLSKKMISYIIAEPSGKYTNKDVTFNRKIAKTLNTGNCGQYRASIDNYIIPNIDDEIKLTKDTENYIEWKEKGKLDMDCRAWKDEKVVSTLHTDCGNIKVLEDSDNLKSKLCNDLIEKGIVKENDVIKHSYTGQIIEGNKKCVEMNNIMPTLTTRADCLGVVVKQMPIENLRIRKLTPKECFRLMGVKDEDFERIAKNQSDSSLYHLAGDSIVVNVLMAIFKEML